MKSVYVLSEKAYNYIMDHAEEIGLGNADNCMDMIPTRFSEEEWCEIAIAALSRSHRLEHVLEKVYKGDKERIKNHMKVNMEINKKISQILTELNNN